MLQNDALEQIQSLVPLIDWKTGLRVWSLFLDLPHTVSVPEPVIASTLEGCKFVEFAQQSELAARELCVAHTDPASSGVNCNDPSDNTEDRYSQNGWQSFDAVSHDENDTASKHVAMTSLMKCTDSLDSNVLVNACDKLEEVSSGTVKQSALSFRATCYRTGKHHCFQSPDAAAHFGGAVQEYFGWNVDLNNYDIEVVLCIESRDIRIGIALTNRSLHRRHITHFGRTTLRPTIAYGMLR